MATIKSIEEKAKAYDEASKWMEGIYPTLTHEQQMEAEAFFQILKESEDEKIRKELVQFFEEKDEEDFEEWIPKAKVLAWLEKKDEHANFCSKIQVGDKVTRNEDGVLVNLTQLKRVANKCIENAIKAKQGEYKPAFDIDIPFGAKDSELMEASYYIPEGFHAEIEGNHVVIKKGEQKSAWSEDDEKGLSDALWCCKQAASIAKDENDMGNAWYAEHWLKSLKDRVQPQPKQEWSVEDNERIEQICEDLKCGLINFKSGRTVKGLHFEEIIESNIDWLKSLKPQSTWKPSDEQIEALEHFIVYHNGSTNYAKDLEELRLQLKTLKGE